MRSRNSADISRKEYKSACDTNTVQRLIQTLLILLALEGGLNPVKSLRSLSRPRIWRDERVRYDGLRGFCVSVPSNNFFHRSSFIDLRLLVWFSSSFFLALELFFVIFFFYSFNFTISFFTRDIGNLNIGGLCIIRGSFVGRTKVSIVWRLPRKVYFTVQLFSGE